MLLPGAQDYLAAFWSLSSDRQIGMQPGQIPASSIHRWIDRNELNAEEAAEFEVCIRAMDAEWLGRAQEGAKPVDSSAPNISDRPMTFDLFDAMFGGSE